MDTAARVILRTYMFFPVLVCGWPWLPEGVLPLWVWRWPLLPQLQSQQQGQLALQWHHCGAGVHWQADECLHALWQGLSVSSMCQRLYELHQYCTLLCDVWRHATGNPPRHRELLHDRHSCAYVCCHSFEKDKGERPMSNVKFSMVGHGSLWTCIKWPAINTDDFLSVIKWMASILSSIQAFAILVRNTFNPSSLVTC